MPTELNRTHPSRDDLGRLVRQAIPDAIEAAYKRGWADREADTLERDAQVLGPDPRLAIAVEGLEKMLFNGLGSSRTAASEMRIIARETLAKLKEAKP